MPVSSTSGVSIGTMRMPLTSQSATFISRIRSAAGNCFSFANVPPNVSQSHLRRGRITVRLTAGKSSFEALMEPDGKLAHWFVVPSFILENEGLTLGQDVLFTLSRLVEQPDPALPEHFSQLLERSPVAQANWKQATTLAKIDWVHWMESAKQDATKRERAVNATDMLESGKKRVCCFDPSGFYSKALSCPVEEDQ